MESATNPYRPASFAQAWELASMIVKSKIVPTLSTPEAAFLVLAAGHELGLSATQAIRSIHIVEGKVTLSSDLIVGLILRSGKCEYFREVESTPERATYETKRKGDDVAIRTTFSISDAKAAGLVTKKSWSSYPAVMLSHRAAAILARKVYPDVILGIYDPDELGVADDDWRPQQESSSQPLPVPSSWEEGLLSAKTVPELQDAARTAVQSGAPKAMVVESYHRLLPAISIPSPMQQEPSNET